MDPEYSYFDLRPDLLMRMPSYEGYDNDICSKNCASKNRLPGRQLAAPMRLNPG